MKQNEVSVRLRPAVDCGLELLLPQHSPPASLARGDVFSSGNISGSCSGLAKEAALAAQTLIGEGNTRIFPCRVWNYFLFFGNSFTFKKKMFLSFFFFW